MEVLSMKAVLMEDVLRRIAADFKKYIRYSFVSAKSQLKSEVANSYLSWLWWILEPLCFMFIYAFIFGVVFKAEETNFSIFIYIGITVWDFFNRTMLISVKLIRNNKGIVSKVYLPKYFLLLTKIWVNGFKMMISFAIVAGMMIFYHIPLTWNIFWVLPILLTLVMLSFGVGTFLMHFGVVLDDLANVVSIVLKIVFYLTGVFYNVSSRVPAPYGEILVKVNPVAFLLDAMRKSVLYGQMPDIIWLALWLCISLAIAYCGIRTIYKNENTYVKVL